MKKFLLKIALCATALLAVGFVAMPLLVSAEETKKNAIESVVTEELENAPSDAETNENQTEIVQETETSKWFDETIKPMLIEYGASVVAFGTAVFFMLKDFNKTKSTLGIAVGALTKSNTNNKDTAKAVEEFKALYEKQKEEYAKQIAEMQSVFVGALEELKVMLADKVNDADDTLHKLLDVERLAYGSNAHLVSNGTAKRIAEVIDHGKAHDEK